MQGTVPWVFLEKVTRRETKFRTVRKACNPAKIWKRYFRTEAVYLLQHKPADNEDELDLVITEKIIW